jgi:hypothetical protein
VGVALGQHLKPAVLDRSKTGGKTTPPRPSNNVVLPDPAVITGSVQLVGFENPEIPDLVLTRWANENPEMSGLAIKLLPAEPDP